MNIVSFRYVLKLCTRCVQKLTSFVGEWLGLAVGQSVGDTDGERLGLSVGEALGEAEGDTDGTSVGDTLGKPEGDSVGFTDGYNKSQSIYTERK